MNPLRRLHDFGQSLWYDNIERRLLQSGELARMIAEDGLRGITSNPTIFEKAITGSKDYDAALASLVKSGNGLDGRALFFDLAIADIQAAADLLRPTYDQSGGRDGFVSLEVSPDLAYDSEATVAEAERLHARVDRPNLMIKVPATKEGVLAFETLTAKGISINVTLLFAVERYQEVVEAYLSGLETRLRRGQPVQGIASVASFFVSRVDSAVDKLLEQHGEKSLQGRIAIANAKLAYAWYQHVFGTPRFENLRQAGAAPQRLLWASTGTKNPAYSDVLYLDALIGPDTVNTVPPATYAAYKDHGQPRATLTEGLDEAKRQVARLKELGIDLAAVTAQLEKEGVQSFAKSFDNLLQATAAKAAAVSGRRAVG
jgi:transaldolase/transaldolase/glucose-6-phosphate isomerase